MQCGLYTSRLVFGVRRGQRMSSCSPGGAQKSMHHPRLRGITSTSDRTAFDNFWGTTATDNQSSSHLIWFPSWVTEPGYRYQSQRLPISNSETKSMTRHQLRENVRCQARCQGEYGNTCCMYANYGKWLTNAGPFLRLYAIPFVLFCSLPGSNISACFSPSHAYHALVVCR